MDDGVALNNFLNVIAGRFVRFEEDVDFIHSAKKIVQIAP